MKIVSTMNPGHEMIDKMKTAFPDEDFDFFHDMEEARTSIPEAEILITYGEDLTEEIINEAIQLKWIMVISAGLELMPLQAIHNRQILVTNARGIHKIQMAEYALSMMLQHVKQHRLLAKQEEKHIWNRSLTLNELAGKTVAILGVGAIGEEIARLSKAFRMNVLGINRSGKSSEFVDEMYRLQDLDVILPRADFIISILPSTNETRYIITERHFSNMKNDAVFMNIGRGDLVEEEILLDAVNTSKIAHIILDVFENEPLTNDHPFWQHDQITVTPHISSRTEHYIPRAFAIFEQNFHAFKGNGKEYINKINLERGY